MLSAFGVEHGIISKMDPGSSDLHINETLKTVKQKAKKADRGAKHVPKQAYPLLHASVVRAYDDSRRNKIRAATKQAVVGTAAGAAGGAAGVVALNIAGKRIKGLSAATKFKDVKVLRNIPKVKNVVLSSDRKIGLAAGAGGSIIGGTTGATGNYYALKSTRKNPKYKFKEGVVHNEY